MDLSPPISTVKLITIPDRMIAKRGPYLLTRRPNYFLNILPELISYCAALGAWKTLQLGLPIYWVLPLLLSLGCSISSAQIEPNAGHWKTWVLTAGNQLRLPPPPDEAATREEIAQLKDIAKQRDAATLDQIVWWNAGPPGYRWTSIAIPPGPANATLHSRIMALLSVAIYDATVAAWDSKYAYQRLHPTAFDPSLTAALPNPRSPSYPSEHAVVAGAQ